MCLAVVALDAHPDYALVVAANRDEWHARPAAPAAKPWQVWRLTHYRLALMGKRPKLFV